MGAKNSKTPTEPRRERWEIDRFEPNPLQKRYYGDLSTHDMKSLAKSIMTHGLKQPIEVLPDGTILDGHQRLAALKLNGATHADVLVRYDLAGATDIDKEREFIGFNLQRRQLTPFEKARAVYGLYLAEKGKKPRSRLYGGDEVGAVERIGQATGMTGRNLRRYFAIVTSPPEVQAAFQRNDLTLVEAARVATLSEGDREKLASCFRAGEDARAAFAAFFPPKPPGHAKPNVALAAFVRDAEAAVADLAARVGEVGVGAIRRHEKSLRAVLALANRLLQRSGAK